MNLIFQVWRRLRIWACLLAESAKSIDWLPFLPALFYSYLYLTIFREAVLLVDDLSVISMMRHNPEIRNLKSPWQAIAYYVSSADASARPIPAAIFSGYVYLIRNHLDFYYLLYACFLASLFIIYKLVRSISDENIAFIVSLVYSLIPVGTSLAFTSIMLGSTLSTIFYCLSLYYIIKKKSLWLSALFFMFSVFSYEVFLPLIIINFLLTDRKWTVRTFYAGGIIIWIFLYRYSLQHYIFPNSIHKERLSLVLNLSRDVEIYKRWLFLLPEFIMGLGRGIKGLRFFSVYDYLVSVFFIVIFCLIILKSRMTMRYDKKKIVLLSILAMFLSNFIFIASDYPLSLNGFYNRMLGAVRLSASIFLVSALLWLASQKAAKLLLCVCVAVFTITTVSVKNAWIFSHHQNVLLFKNLKSKLPEDPLTNIIYIRYRNSIDDVGQNLYDKADNDVLHIYKKPHFVFNEPLFTRYTIGSFLQERAGIKSSYQINYYYTPPSELITKDHYIYDVTMNSLTFVECDTSE